MFHRLGYALGAFCALAVLLPAVASAGTVAVSGGVLTYTANAGGQNALAISFDAANNEYRVTDAPSGAPVIGCNAPRGGDPTNTRRCPAAGVTSIRIDVRDRDDTATQSANTVTVAEGGDGDDVLTVSGTGADTARGGTGNDTFAGGGGNDTYEGGPDDDAFASDAGADSYAGGTGNDGISYRSHSTAVSVSLNDSPDDGAMGEGDNVRADVEDVEASELGDTVSGSPATNVLLGRDGNDRLDPLGGTDFVSAGGADDTIQLRDGAADTARCGSGSDTVTADTFDTLDPDCENVSRPAPETTIDSAPPDPTDDRTPTFAFSSNDATASFQCRFDDQGFGPCVSPYLSPNDLAYGPHAFEVRAVDALGNADPTPARRTFTVAILPGRCTNRSGPPATGGNDTLNGTEGGDLIRALAGDDRVNGVQADDCLFGDEGNDTIDGGDGRDDVAGGPGRDRLEGATSRDRLTGDDGRDNLSGGSDSDTLSGGAGHDNLSGGAGSDRIAGGAGNDRLNGGAGRNLYAGGTGNDRINAKNGRREAINCGPGSRDRVRADFSDRIAGCERVVRARG